MSIPISILLFYAGGNVMKNPILSATSCCHPWFHCFCRSAKCNSGTVDR